MVFLRRLKSLFTSSLTRTQLEHAWVVTVSDTGVSCRRPSGLTEMVAWDDLRAVLIETNDSGPWGADVFWILVGEQRGCVIPLGATGEAALLERLQALTGFDNNVVIQAMASTDNQRFLCWKKKL